MSSRSQIIMSLVEKSSVGNLSIGQKDVEKVGSKSSEKEHKMISQNGCYEISYTTSANTSNTAEESQQGQKHVGSTSSVGQWDVDNIKRSNSAASITTSISADSDDSDTSFIFQDCDDIYKDKTYEPSASDNSSDMDKSTSSTHCQVIETVRETSTSVQNETLFTTPPKKGYKRKLNTENWKKNTLKIKRNTGQEYKKHTKSKTKRQKRDMKLPCGEKCKLKCHTKFSHDQRLSLFDEYWGLGDIEKQWEFINKSMVEVQPKYKYVRVGGVRAPRNNNNAFYFVLNGQKIRVCKFFFKRTLDINDRPIRTVQVKRNKVGGVFLEMDRRGKHNKQKNKS